MATAISKNSRKGQKTEVNLCKCGEVVKMRTVYDNRRLKHFAECTGCGRTARKPNMLK